MGSWPYSQWMQPGAALGPVHTLAPVHTRRISAPCSVPVSPARPCHGDAQRAPRKGGRGTGSWLVQKTQTNGVHA